jgi:hypothetical protein
MHPTDPAHEAYYRLLAARRDVPPEEAAETEKREANERLRLKIRRKLPKVY